MLQTDSKYHHIKVSILMIAVMFLILIPLTSKSHADDYTDRTTIIITKSFEKLDCPYVWGANSTTQFDCSSLVQYTFRQANIKLPRTSAEQAKCGEVVSPNDLRAGDLIFMDTRSGISYPSKTTHVGIYMGKDYVLHASSAKGKVVIEKLSDSGMIPIITTIRRMY